MYSLVDYPLDQARDGKVQGYQGGQQDQRGNRPLQIGPEKHIEPDD